MRVFFFLLFIAVTQTGLAQQLLRGYVKTIAKDEGLMYVLVQNNHHQQHFYTKENGYFEIVVNVGDKITFSRVGFEQKEITISQQNLQQFNTIYLNANNALKEVVIRAKTLYQIDSLKRYELYQPALERKKDKPKVVVVPLGIAIENAVSSWMQYIAPKSRRKWKFQKNFADWEKQKFIASVYTNERVAQITKLAGDSLQAFMVDNPMPYGFARNAKLEEVENWIRLNYVLWMKQQENSK